MQNGERFYSISDYLKQEFGGKTIKLAIDGGFTCPNRDGTKGYGGCAFCSSTGSGEFASSIQDQINLLSDKWPNANHIAYFQNHTNTYAPVEHLRELYYSALDDSRIKGIAIATRADCLGDDVLDLLSEINESHFLWVELGLQTIHSKTSELMGIGYDLSVFDEAIHKLHARGIKTVVHIILGLPGETRKDMFDTVRYVSEIHPFGLKIHMLNIVRGSRLAEMMPDYVPFASIEEYASMVVDVLRVIPPDITIHRISADAERKTLIAPEWSYQKRTILNTINKMLKDTGSYQGKDLE